MIVMAATRPTSGAQSARIPPRASRKMRAKSAKLAAFDPGEREAGRGGERPCGVRPAGAHPAEGVEKDAREEREARGLRPRGEESRDGGGRSLVSVGGPHGKGHGGRLAETTPGQ